VKRSLEGAQICMNGHVINAHLTSDPDLNEMHCSRCGEETMIQCLECDASLRGARSNSSMANAAATEPRSAAQREYERPSFCHECGGLFPWTECAIRAAIEQAMESDKLNEKEKHDFEENVRRLVRDPPAAGIAANRISTIMSKSGKGAADVVRGVVIQFASRAILESGVFLSVVWPSHRRATLSVCEANSVVSFLRDAGTYPISTRGVTRSASLLNSKYSPDLKVNIDATRLDGIVWPSWRISRVLALK